MPQVQGGEYEAQLRPGSEAAIFLFEERDRSEVMEMPEVDDYSPEVIAYHLRLLHDAGLLRCEPVKSSTSDRVIRVLPFELTWEGSEALALSLDGQQIRWDVGCHDMTEGSLELISAAFSFLPGWSRSLLPDFIRINISIVIRTTRDVRYDRRERAT